MDLALAMQYTYQHDYDTMHSLACSLAERYHTPYAVDLPCCPNGCTNRIGGLYNSIVPAIRQSATFLQCCDAKELPPHRHLYCTHCRSHWTQLL